MPYEEEKDEVVKGLGTALLSDNSEMSASLRSYDGGPVKLCLTRHFIRKNGDKASNSIARLRQDEFEALQRLLGRNNPFMSG